MEKTFTSLDYSFGMNLSFVHLYSVSCLVALLTKMIRSMVWVITTQGFIFVNFEGKVVDTNCDPSKDPISKILFHKACMKGNRNSVIIYPTLPEGWVMYSISLCLLLDRKTETWLQC